VSQPSDAPADEGRWREVWRGGGAHVKPAADALHAAGIPVRIAGAGPSFHGDARLLVPEGEFARAKALVPKAGPGSVLKRALRALFPFGPGRM
jgi:hypothetical protein